MGTGYGYRAGCRFCSRLCGNDCLARGYCSYFARGRINGCNSGLIGRPNHCVGRIGRSDRCCQTGVTVTGSQRQFALVKSNAGRRLRCGSDGDRSAVGIIVDGVVFFFRIGKKEEFLSLFNLNDRLRAGGCALLYLAGEGYQQGIAGAGIVVDAAEIKLH